MYLLRAVAHRTQLEREWDNNTKTQSLAYSVAKF